MSSRPPRGTPEYDAYKASKRAEEARYAGSNTLSVAHNSSSRNRSRSRHRDDDDDRESRSAAGSHLSVGGGARRERSRVRDRSRVDDERDRDRSKVRYSDNGRERERSRVRFETQDEEEERRERKERKREEKRREEKEEEGTRDRSGHYYGSAAVSASGSYSGEKVKKEKKSNSGVYTALEPPVAYQPPGYVAGKVSGAVLGVLPGVSVSGEGKVGGKVGKLSGEVGYGGGGSVGGGKVEGKYNHSTSVSLGGASGTYGSDVSYSVGKSDKKDKYKKDEYYGDRPPEFGDYSSGSEHGGRYNAEYSKYDTYTGDTKFGTSGSVSYGGKVKYTVGPTPPPKISTTAPEATTMPGAFAAVEPKKDDKPPSSPNPFSFQTGGPTYIPPETLQSYVTPRPQYSTAPISSPLVSAAPAASAFYSPVPSYDGAGMSKPSGYNPKPVPQYGVGTTMEPVTPSAAAFAGGVAAGSAAGAAYGASYGHQKTQSLSVGGSSSYSAGASLSAGGSFGHQKSSSLSIPGAPPAGLSPLNTSGFGPAPQPIPSPALQPYYGTYQSISPMPSPLMGPHSPSSASFLSASPSNSAAGSFALGPPAYPQSGTEASTTSSHHKRHKSKTKITSTSHSVSIGGSIGSSGTIHTARPDSPSGSSRPSSPTYDDEINEVPYNPATDAKVILSELKSTFSKPSVRPLINILPTLTPTQLKSLRAEYKHQYHNVNLAKHIKSVFTVSTPFGKLCFATALGPYESEAWFANSWYQKRETRNELLIESLMGKTNSEIAHIKSAFKDAKYDSSLEKAVTAELPGNKFRYAVTLQLSCVRQEEDAKVDTEGVRQDVARLGKILEERMEGGETEMIEILVSRSNRWLKEVARMYRRVYERDLAKAIMKRSKNLVGEVLLHILNGAVDKPLRDAKLLAQAIDAAVEEKRDDLLISRATRIHWDPKHLKAVKVAFRKKYRIDLGERLKQVTRGSYGEFLVRMVREY